MQNSFAGSCHGQTRQFGILAKHLVLLVAIYIVLAADIACSAFPASTNAANNPSPLIRLTISPASTILGPGELQRFQAYVQGTSNTGVAWSATAGQISGDGEFIAPSVTQAAIAITATSLADSSKKASAVISMNSGTGNLSIGTTSLPEARQGTFYSETLSAVGGSSPYQWGIASGALPAGLRLVNSTGILTGTSAASGSFPFTAKVTDVSGHSSEKALTLTVGNLSLKLCGPPDYYCSRSDTVFSPVANPMPSWGGLIGTNTTVTDADFHNPIVRVTDGSLGRTLDYCTGLGGSGDVPQLWNADSTLLLICDNMGQYFPIGFDPVNFKSLGPIYGTAPIYLSGGGVFSHSDPNMFYGLSKGQLLSINYSDRSKRPTPQLLYDFHNCGLTNIEWQSNGGSSQDDTVFSAAFSLTSGQGTGYFVAAYNSSSNVCFNLNTSTGIVTRYPGGVVIGRVNIPDRFYVHNAKMKDGTTLVVASQSCISNCMGNPYAWVIGTTQMYALGAPKGGGHWAVGCKKWLNQPGDFYDYSVTRDFETPSLWKPVWSVSGAQCGNAPLLSCVQPFDAHPAWLGDCSDTGPVLMTTVSPTDVIQFPYQNEVVGFTTDGSHRQIRFAHTYSSLALQGFNAQYAIGEPSQDGRFYAWTTKAGGQFGCSVGTVCALTARRSDVLVVKLQ